MHGCDRAATGRSSDVGATGPAPETRTWLHLHHDDPEIGHVRARHPSFDDEPLDVLALRLPPGVQGRDARQAATARDPRARPAVRPCVGIEATVETFTAAVAAA